MDDSCLTGNNAHMKIYMMPNPTRQLLSCETLLQSSVRLLQGKAIIVRGKVLNMHSCLWIKLSISVNPWVACFSFCYFLAAILHPPQPTAHGTVFTLELNDLSKMLHWDDFLTDIVIQICKLSCTGMYLTCYWTSFVLMFVVEVRKRKVIY